jgi:hypothetical protein
LVLFSCSKTKRNVEYKEEEIIVNDLDDLLFKYNVIEVDNCEELFAVGDEMYDIYINTILEADKGNEKAISDLMSFHLFMDKFDEKLIEVSKDCPDEFKKWSMKIEERIEGPNLKLKLMDIFRNEYEPIELDESITNELETQLQGLQNKLNRIFREDSIETLKKDTAYFSDSDVD